MTLITTVAAGARTTMSAKNCYATEPHMVPIQGPGHGFMGACIPGITHTAHAHRSSQTSDRPQEHSLERAMTRLRTPSQAIWVLKARTFPSELHNFTAAKTPCLRGARHGFGDDAVPVGPRRAALTKRGVSGPEDNSATFQVMSF